jgi:hypothetical protein
MRERVGKLTTYRIACANPDLKDVVARILGCDFTERIGQEAVDADISQVLHDEAV